MVLHWFCVLTRMRNKPIKLRSSCDGHRALLTPTPPKAGSSAIGFQVGGPYCKCKHLGRLGGTSSGGCRCLYSLKWSSFATLQEYGPFLAPLPALVGRTRERSGQRLLCSSRVHRLGIEAVPPTIPSLDNSRHRRGTGYDREVHRPCHQTPLFDFSQSCKLGMRSLNPGEQPVAVLSTLVPRVTAGVIACVLRVNRLLL